MPIITSRLTPIPARTRTLLMGDYRYTRNAKREQQLFKLSEDPNEMHDLKDRDPAQAKLVEALADAMMMADDSSRGAPATEKS